MSALPLALLFSSFVFGPSTAASITEQPQATNVEESDNFVIVYGFTGGTLSLVEECSVVSRINDRNLAKYLEMEGNFSALSASEVIGRLISRGYKIVSTLYTAAYNPGQKIVWTLVKQ